MMLPSKQDFCVCIKCGIGFLIQEVGWAEKWTCYECLEITQGKGMSIEPVETMNNLSQEQHRKILSLQHRNYVVLSTYPKLDGTYFTNQHASDLSVILFAWTNIAEHLDSEKYLATDATIAAEVAADTVVTIAANAANTANTAAIASSIAYNAEWAYVWKMYSKHLFIELEKVHGKVKATEFDTIVKFVEEK